MTQYRIAQRVVLLSTACMIGLTLALMPTMAFAADQAADAPASSADRADDGSNDIIVTSQRRRERLQDIPIAVTAFTEQAIAQLHLNDAISVSKFVPSMISQHNAGLASANAYYLRGLGNSQSVATFDAPVTTYVDDVYIARQNANNYAFFDTERVEVLRGPQGTLFGRNTTGGAINVIMRKPSEKMGVKLETTAGSYDRYTIKGVVDLPLSETVLTKLAAYYVTDGGYLKNITTGDSLGDEKNFGVRGDIRFLPTPQLTIDLSAEFTSNRSTYLGMRSVAGGTNPYLVPTSATTPIFYETAAGLPKTDCTDDNITLLLTTGKGNCALSKNYAASLNITYETDAGTLNYIGGYRKLDQGYINQYDANNTNKFNGFIIVDNGHNEQWSHELKFNGDLAGDRIHYVTGLFYLRETTDDRQTTFSGGTTAFRATQDQHLFHTVETAAIYAQADFDVTDKLTLTTGGRYTWERKNVDYALSTAPQFNAPTAPFAQLGYTGAQVAAFGIPLQQTVRRFTPRFAISYKANPDVLLFASATNGFKSGGWNGGSAVPQNATAFRPEKTWSYEVGVKSELFDKRLRLNATGYLADTTDLQVTAAVTNNFTTPPTIASLPFNAGTLRVYGLEVESSLVLSRDFSLFANGSVMHGEYTYVVPDSTVFTADKKPVRVPTFQFSGGGTYMTEVPALAGSLGGSVAYRHNSSYWIAILNTAKAPVEDFVDLALNYKTQDNRFALSFEVSNLTKQRTVTANFLSLFPGDPRRFTARLKVNF